MLNPIRAKVELGMRVLNVNDTRIPQPRRRSLHDLSDRRRRRWRSSARSSRSSDWRREACHELAARRVHQCGRRQRRADGAEQPLLRAADAAPGRGPTARRCATRPPACAAAGAVHGSAPVLRRRRRPHRQHRGEPARRSAALLADLRRQRRDAIRRTSPPRSGTRSTSRCRRGSGATVARRASTSRFSSVRWCRCRRRSPSSTR